MAWQVYDAKARFSEFLAATLSEGPQILTRRGVETAVLVPIGEWRQLQGQAKNSSLDPLLDPEGPRDLFLPLRRSLQLRPVLLDEADQP